MREIRFNRFIGGLIGICVLAGGEVVFAAGEVSVKPGRENALYIKGEAVSFDVAIGETPSIQLDWSLSRDGKTPLEQGTLELKDGKAIVTGMLQEPGFLRCTVQGRVNNKPVNVTATAAVSPEEIKASGTPPEDFELFWEREKELLSKVPMTVKQKSVAFDKHPNVEVTDVKVKCLGAPVSGYFAKPKNAGKGTLPAILLFHGAGVDGSLLENAAQWASEGALALDINAHGLPNGEPKSFYDTLREDYLYEYSSRQKVSREHHYFVGMILRSLRALDFLTSQPEWNGRLIVYGSSQGGAQAVFAAGLDERVGFFVAAVPAYADVTGASVGRAPGYPRFVYNEQKEIDPSAVEIARYFDLVNFIRMTKADGFFSVNFLDTICPPETVYALYNTHAGKKEIRHETAFGHAYTPGTGKAMRTAARKYLFVK